VSDQFFSARPCKRIPRHYTENESYRELNLPLSSAPWRAHSTSCCKLDVALYPCVCVCHTHTHTHTHTHVQTPEDTSTCFYRIIDDVFLQRTLQRTHSTKNNSQRRSRSEMLSRCFRISSNTHTLSRHPPTRAFALTLSLSLSLSLSHAHTHTHTHTHVQRHLSRARARTHTHTHK
jgi:hypothetical protein